MITSENIQRMTVSIEFDYEADVFEGDGDDMYVLAEDEKDYLEKAVRDCLEDITPITNFDLTVTPDFS